MADIEKIRTAFERNKKALELRPSVGQKTASTKVRVRNDMTCEVEDGPWRMTTTCGKQWGGNEEVHPLSVLGRGALGSCLALGCVIWAAQLGVSLEGVEVEVQAELDARGTFDMDNVSAGYQAITYIVTIESPAPQEDIERVLDMADAHSTWLNNFKRSIPVRRELRVVAPKA